MHVCKYISQRVRRIGECNVKSSLRVFQQKKMKKEEIEFHNSIQDYAFTTFLLVVEKCFEKCLC